MSVLYLSDLTDKIIGAAIEVHKILGPGLLESAYESCLEFELFKLGLDVKRQVTFPIIYKGVKINSEYRLDLVVNNKVIIELKLVKRILEIHKAQLMSYLRLSNIKVGLLINFNERYLKDGIVRRVI